MSNSWIVKFLNLLWNNTESRTEKNHLKSKWFGGITDPHTKETERKEVSVTAKVKKRQSVRIRCQLLLLSLRFPVHPFPSLPCSEFVSLVSLLQYQPFYFFWDILSNSYLVTTSIFIYSFNSFIFLSYLLFKTIAYFWECWHTAKLYKISTSTSYWRREVTLYT